MGYILNFQNNSNNMKNEIGRKITSLTLMTIMFAGGMTLAIPGFLPDSAIPIEAFADRGTTNGTLYVSSTEVQGAQVIEIVIDDPTLSKNSTNSAVTVDITPSGGSTATMTMFQMQNGLYYAYLVDDDSAEDADAIGSTSLDFGKDCDLTYTLNSNDLDLRGIDTFIEGNNCTATGTTNNTPFSALQNEPEEIKAGTTSLSGPVNIGNVSSMVDGTWGLIYAVDMADDNLLEYGSTSIAFTY